MDTIITFGLADLAEVAAKIWAVTEPHDETDDILAPLRIISYSAESAIKAHEAWIDYSTHSATGDRDEFKAEALRYLALAAWQAITAMIKVTGDPAEVGGTLIDGRRAMLQGLNATVRQMNAKRN